MHHKDMGTLSLQFSAVSKLKISVLIKSCWIVTGISASVKMGVWTVPLPAAGSQLERHRRVVMISLLSHEPDTQALVCRNYKSYAAD